MSRVVRPLLLPAVLAMLWEMSYRAWPDWSVFLPGPSAIARASWRLLLTSELPRALADTGGLTLLALLLAASAGIPMGLLLGTSGLLHSGCRALIDFLRSLPASLVYPIALLFLGIGRMTPLAVAAFGAMWPILITSLDAIRDLAPARHEVAALLNLGRLDRWLHVYIPFALPHVLSGLRVALSVSLILVVTVEMIAGSRGMGYRVVLYQRSFHYPEMYGLILATGLLGLCLQGAFEAIVGFLFPWVASTRLTEE